MEAKKITISPDMVIETIEISQEMIDEVDIKMYGSLERAKAAKIEEAKLWCKCEEDHNAYYVGNGESEECHKHHWRCNKCKKIVQIG